MIALRRRFRRSWSRSNLSDEAQGHFDEDEHLKAEQGVLHGFRSIKSYDKPQRVVLISGEARTMGFVETGDNTSQPIKHVRK